MRSSIRNRLARMRRPPLALELAATVVTQAIVLLDPHLVEADDLALMLLASACWLLVVTDPRLESRPRWAVGAIAAAFLVALAMPPRGSHDLWSYVMYGRTVAVHHASPYVHAPSAYPSDPFLHLVGAGWQGTRSVYGPLFTGVSSVLAKLAGASVLRARLVFQGLALVAVVSVLVLVWRETASVRSLAFVGLHPVVVTAIVNGGHNDALVGLAVVVGAVLLARRRAFAAGIVVGLGLLVKASTGFGIVGLAVWAVARDRTIAARFLVATACTSALGYAFTGTVALRVLTGDAARTSRASVWSAISAAGPHLIGAVALVTVCGLAVLGAYRFRNTALPLVPIGIAFAAYLVAGAYVQPWYAAWALPALALVRRSPVALLVGGQAAVLVALYELSRRVDGFTVAGVLRGVLTVVVAFGVLAVFVAELVRAGSRRPVPARVD